MRQAPILVCVAALAVATGCPSGGGGGGQPSGIPTRSPLAVDDVRGLSGIAVDDEENLWLVAERDRVVLVKRPDGALSRLAIVGVEAGYDVESVAHLGGTSFALGVERNTGDSDAGTTALILRATASATALEVTDRIELDTSLWSLNLNDNEGVEGLCHADGVLVAGVETVGGGSGGRYAPVGVYDLTARTWRGYRLRLSTDSGSLSAIACRMRGDKLEVIGIERHFSVLRVLRATLPAEAGEVNAEVLLNLDGFANETGLNIEGVAVASDGDLTMVVDNSYRGVTGPNELVLVKGVAK